MREQLGREPTTAFAVVARCTGGHPLVIRNAPLDVNGDPFPTTYWLTCPEAVKAVARVESEGWIAQLNDRVQDDEVFDEALETAHRAYAEERGADLPEARAWGGVAGTRTGIKCPSTPGSARGAWPRSIRARTRSGCWSSSPVRRVRPRPSSLVTW